MRLIVATLCIFLLTGCIARLPPPSTTHTIAIGPSLLDETFDTRGDWDAYHKQGLYADVVEGSYRLETSVNQYAYVLKPSNWDDIVIEADFYLREAAEPC